MGRAIVMLIAFGIGSATPLAATAYASRRILARRATLLRTGRSGQAVLGSVLVVTALLVWTGFDKAIEAALVEHLPAWWVAVLARV